MVDVCFPVRGGRDVAVAVAMTPVLPGFRSDTSPPKGITMDWEFIDWPFDVDLSSTSALSSALDRHLTFIEIHQPKIAVAPDIQGEMTADRALDVAAEIDRHAETTVVVPKSGGLRPEDVPPQYRVGVPNRGDAEVPFERGAYRQADSVHILGGTFESQLDWRDRLDNIGSVDTSWAFRSAFDFRKVWTPEGYFDVPRGADVGYSAMVISLRYYAAEWGARAGSFIPEGAMSTGTPGTPFREEEAIPAAFPENMSAQLPDADDLRTVVERHLPDAEVLEFNEDFPVLIDVPESPAEMGDRRVTALGDALAQMFEFEFDAIRGSNIIRVTGTKDDWIGGDSDFISQFEDRATPPADDGGDGQMTFDLF